MNNPLSDASYVAKVAMRLVDAVDALDGVADMPFADAKRLAQRADAVRTLCGHESKLHHSKETPA